MITSYFKIYHAYWPAENTCIALKKVSNINSGEREVEILKHFKRLREHQKNHIIEMFG